MAIEPEETSEPKKEIADDLSGEKRNEENTEIQTTSVNQKDEGLSTNPRRNDEKSVSTNPKREDEKSTSTKREDKKWPKICDEDPYIVKLFKSLMNPPGSQKSAEEKKKK